MKKDWTFLSPLFFILWPYFCAVVVVALALMQIAPLVEMLWQALGFYTIAIFVLGLLTASHYKKTGQYHKLAFWGMMQKLSYIPIIIVYVMLQGTEQNYGFSIDDSRFGGMELLLVAIVAMAILLVYGILLIGALIVLIVSASYTVKATNLLYRRGYIGKTNRFLLVLGNIVPVLDIPCSIIIYTIARKYKHMQPIIIQ